MNVLQSPQVVRKFSIHNLKNNIRLIFNTLQKNRHQWEIFRTQRLMSLSLLFRVFSVLLFFLVAVALADKHQDKKTTGHTDGAGARTDMDADPDNTDPDNWAPLLNLNSPAVHKLCVEAAAHPSQGTHHCEELTKLTHCASLDRRRDTLTKVVCDADNHSEQTFTVHLVKVLSKMNIVDRLQVGNQALASWKSIQVHQTPSTSFYLGAGYGSPHYFAP